MGHLRQTGFSLLELLIVLGLMTIAAVLALSTVGNSDNQRRFEETRSKLDKIRSSIIGKPQVINGQLSINGFVADMGRLPFNLEELLIEPIDCDGDDTIDSDDLDSDPSIDRCLWDYDEDTEIWSGWHGPYINSIAADYRDGWGNGDSTTDNKGWDWDNTTVIDGLTITSAGLDHLFTFDTNGEDTDNAFTGTVDEGYADSSLQTLTLIEDNYSVNLPFNPLQLSVDKAPFCGQCRDKDNVNVADCNIANHNWNTELSYCVEDTAATPEDCDAVATETTSWVPLYNHCSNPLFTNETDCTNASENWRLIDDSLGNQCTDYNTKTSTPAYNFITFGDEDFCARIMRVNHGLIITDSHKNSDASVIDITVTGQSGSINEKFTFNLNMETDEATPDAGLTLPQGHFRVGLYIYDSVTSTCTEDPYPTASAQALSEVITLSSQYPLNLGTSTNPITLQWRSQ